MFTKKHYATLAKTISEQRKANAVSVYQMEYDLAVEKLAERLADTFAKLDARFDKSQFMHTCLS